MRYRIVSIEEAEEHFRRLREQTGRGGLFRTVTVTVRGERRRIRTTQDPELLQRLADAYDELGVVKYAGQRVGLDHRRAHWYLDRLGMIERAHRAEKVTYRYRRTGKAIETLYPWGTVHRCVVLREQEQLTNREIAARIGVPDYTVWHWLSSLGLEMDPNYQARVTRHRRRRAAGRGYGDTPEEEDAEIIRMYLEEELDTHRIARRLRLHQSYVLRVLDRHGVERRDASEARRLSFRCRRRQPVNPRRAAPRSSVVPFVVRELERLEEAEGLTFQQAYETAVCHWLPPTDSFRAGGEPYRSTLKLPY